MKSRNDTYDISGIGKVYRFTLAQTFKSPAYRASFIVFVLLFIFMGPINSLSQLAGESAAMSGDALYTENEAESIRLVNKTVLPLGAERLTDYLKDTAYEGLPVTETEELKDLSEGEIGLIFDRQTIDEEEYYVVSGVIADDSLLSATEMETLCRYLRGLLSQARREAADLSDTQLEILQTSIQDGDCISLSDYRKQDRGGYTDFQVFQLNMIYCIVLVIMVALTSSYVVSSVMEEKSSRLVENLLVSVRPLALVGGKILAMMSYVALMILAGIAGSFLSNRVMALISGGRTEAAEVSLDFSSLFSAGIGRSLFLLLCMLLSYLMFAILAGVLGSACVKPEDMQSAIGIMTILNMTSYMFGMVAPNIGSRGLDAALSIIPIVSGYVAPVYLICGRITPAVFLTGLALQLALIVLLFLLCARTYRRLIVNDSKRLNVFQIVKLSLQEV